MTQLKSTGFEANNSSLKSTPAGVNTRIQDLPTLSFIFERGVSDDDTAINAHIAALGDAIIDLVYLKAKKILIDEEAHTIDTALEVMALTRDVLVDIEKEYLKIANSKI